MVGGLCRRMMLHEAYKTLVDSEAEYRNIYVWNTYLNGVVEVAITMSEIMRQQMFGLKGPLEFLQLAMRQMEVADQILADRVTKSIWLRACFCFGDWKSGEKYFRSNYTEMHNDFVCWDIVVRGLFKSDEKQAQEAGWQLVGELVSSAESQMLVIDERLIETVLRHLLCSAGKHHKLATSSAEADQAPIDNGGAVQSGEVLWSAERDSSTSGTAYELAPQDRHSADSISSSFIYDTLDQDNIRTTDHVRLRDMSDGRSSFGAEVSRERTDQSLPNETNEPIHKTGASMLASFFNLTNAIVGAGAIGLPYAIRQAGFLIGVLMVVLLALLVDWTLRVLALNSKLSGQQTYQGLVEHCFGRAGLLANSLFQGAMAGGGMASFIVIVGDTLPHVFSALFPGIGQSDFGRVVFSRRFVIAFFVICLAYPLSLYRDVGKLGKTSAFAVVAMCTIIISVVVEGPRIDSALRADPGTPFMLANTGIFQAVGIITFAFVCHHNSFMIYGSLRKPTLNRYFEVIHISTAIATAASLVIAMVGYIYFREKTQGNILNNFPQDNVLINIARFLFALNMITTFPMETLVAREVVDQLLFRGMDFSMKRHVIITTVLCAGTLVIGETVCNLGVLLELTGGMSASFLAFIMPPACFIRLTNGPLLSRKTLPHWLCICFGVLVMVLSTVLSIRHAVTSHDSNGSCWNVQ
ncbi:hypothetical protein IWW36_003237 [Coemansia brasiliensis]|uniref:Amino acid transporter transmembrane domain-containing protein n=1 Tax=Coemansia brasiliensis TaxID=2650707 RepID=A0A9W8IAI9_9FUNG|nr:hypothetical protein IWW36_003237 [Coemansia brasiliensis]